MRYRANLIGVAAFCALAAGAATWGWLDAGGLRADSPGHATALIAGAIGLMLSLPVLGSAMATSGRASATRAAPLGRWYAGPADIAAFLEWHRRSGEVNEWRPTAGERAKGIEVCWAGESLVVGGHYWGLGPENYPSIRALEARGAPPGSVVLRYRQLWAHNMTSRPRLIQTEREFRFPAPDESQARALVGHFARLADAPPTPARRRREIRLKVAVWLAAALFVALLATGLGFAWHDRAHGIFRPTGARAALIAATVLGIMGAPIMLLAAWQLRSRREG